GLRYSLLSWSWIKPLLSYPNSAYRLWFRIRRERVFHQEDSLEGQGWRRKKNLNIVGSKSIEKKALPQQIIVEIKKDLSLRLFLYFKNVRHLKRCGSSSSRCS